jgi:hypothetical protein
MEGWRKTYNEEFRDSYYLPYQIKDYEMGGACSTHWSDMKCIQNFGQKT